MRRLFTMLGAGLTLGFALAAHAQVTSGTISGTVKDATGAVLPGAAVVLLHEGTGIARSVQADEAGRYSAPSLSVGMYRVTASRNGFQTVTRSGIELTVGRQAVVNFDLPVGAVTQTVEVTGEAPLVNTLGGTLGDTIERSAISELPLNGRDLAQLVVLQAGAVQYTQDSNDGGKLISVGGGRTRQANVFNVDGVSMESFNSRTPTGISKSWLGSEGIQEFKIETNAFSAEYGRASGGVFNLVTKSGTNQLHGSVFEYLRNDNLDANKWEANKFGSEKLEFKQNQFGFSLGGPIRKDKTFFFGTYEGSRQRRGETHVSKTFSASLRQGFVPTLDRNGNVTGVTPVTIDQRIKPYLDFWPLPNGEIHADGTGDFIFPYSYPNNDNYYQGRVDHQFSDRDLVYGRYTMINGNEMTVLNFPEYLDKQTTRAHSATIEEKHIFSPALLNSSRLGFSRHTVPEGFIVPEVAPALRFVPILPYLGSLSPGGGISAAGTSSSGVYRPITSYQLTDDVTYTKGRNTFKSGFSGNRIFANGCNQGTDRGSYGFGSVADFFIAKVDSFSAQAPGSDVCRSYTENIIGMYFQDEIRVASRFTLTPGLRYEFITVPKERYGKVANFRGDLAFIQRAGWNDITVGNPFIDNPSLRNFAPRLGFAWDVLGDGKTALRGGFGLYYQQFDHADIFNQGIAWRMPPMYIELAASGITIPFPNMWTLCAGEDPSKPPQNPVCVTRPRPQFVQRHFGTPYVMQYNLNIQRQVSSDTVVTVGYAGTKSVHMWINADLGAPKADVVDGRLVFPATARRLNPNFDQLTYRYNGGDARYNALQVSLRKKLARGFQAVANYTFSRSTNDLGGEPAASGLLSNLSYYYFKSLYRSLSNLDVRNTFTFSSTYELPIGPGKAFGSGLRGVGERLLGGWQLGGILTLQNGFPATLTITNRLSSLGIRQELPDLAPGAGNNPSRPGNPDQYFDPNAFLWPATRTLGNLGRNTLTIPGLATVDFSLAKEFKVRETSGLQFRFEAFNFFNHPNFGAPDRNIFDRNGVRNSTAGRITNTVTTARQIQLALKYIF